MASKHAISIMMQCLRLSFAGDVTKEKCRLYHAALEDVSDEEIEAATRFLVQEHRGEFIPTIAAIRDAAGVNARGLAIDLEATLRAISGLGEYHIESGRWRYPSAVRVVDALGDGIGTAYGEAGCALLFSDNQITRETAQRDFVRSLTRAVARRGAVAALNPAPEQPKLAAGAEATL